MFHYPSPAFAMQAEEDDPSLSAMLSALPPKNANLGRFTNFVNLLDMCGVSVYSGLLRVPGEPLTALVDIPRCGG